MQPEFANLDDDRPAPLLVDAREAARLLNVSKRTIFRWAAGHVLPESIRLGGGRFWRYDDLAAWVEGGCPRLAR